MAQPPVSTPPGILSGPLGAAGSRWRRRRRLVLVPADGASPDLLRLRPGPLGATGVGPRGGWTPSLGPRRLAGRHRCAGRPAPGRGRRRPALPARLRPGPPRALGGGGASTGTDAPPPSSSDRGGRLMAALVGGIVGAVVAALVASGLVLATDDDGSAGPAPTTTSPPAERRPRRGASTSSSCSTWPSRRWCPSTPASAPSPRPWARAAASSSTPRASSSPTPT